MARILQKRRRGKKATIVSVPPIFCPKAFCSKNVMVTKMSKKRCLIIQKKDNGLPLCESEETSLDSKSEKSVSIVAIPEDYVYNQADLNIIEPIKKSLVNLERNKLCSLMMLS